MEYFTFVGSYDGAIKVGGKWIRATGLNCIDKTGWKRHQGPPNKAILMAIKTTPSIEAKSLFPSLSK